MDMQSIHFTWLTGEDEIVKPRRGDRGFDSISILRGWRKLIRHVSLENISLYLNYMPDLSR